MRVGQYVVLGDNAWKISGIYLAATGGQSVVGLLPNKPTWQGGAPVDEMLVPVEFVEAGGKAKVADAEPVSRGANEALERIRFVYDWHTGKLRTEKIEKPELQAADILKAAATHLEDRKKVYDKPDGERSMLPTVAAFNATTGHKLTEEQGWLFMELLKCVRAEHNGYRPDNYEDGVAYCALKGEAAARNRGESST